MRTSQYRDLQGVVHIAWHFPEQGIQRWALCETDARFLSTMTFHSTELTPDDESFVTCIFCLGCGQ